MLINTYIFFRAADWKLDQPDWTGRMRVVAKGKDLAIKLEDKTSGVSHCLCFNMCRSANILRVASDMRVVVFDA